MKRSEKTALVLISLLVMSAIATVVAVWNLYVWVPA